MAPEPESVVPTDQPVDAASLVISPINNPDTDSENVTVIV